MYNVADDVLKCAKWHKANHHSRQTVVDCIFYGLYESKYGKSISMAEIWADNKDIDAELAQQAKMIANQIYEGEN
jgi:hypothetical protein